mgnify:CR=1 FL=1
MHGVDTRQHDIVATARSRKAARLIAHLDDHFGRPVVTSDIEGWKSEQWQRTFKRAHETFNTKEPWLTIEAVTNRVAVREQVGQRRRLVRH